MRKGRLILSFTLIIVSIMIVAAINSGQELQTIQSEKELYNFYNRGYRKNTMPLYKQILTLPFSIILLDDYMYEPTYQWNDVKTVDDAEATNSTGAVSNTQKDYSKTNIQVEGVDEADIIKTDGDYIYSISDKYVVITNVKDKNDIKIEKKLNENDNEIPIDLIIYKDKLVVISVEYSRNRRQGKYLWYYPEKNTVVNIYNINNKEKPKLEKNYKINEEYQTTRVIDGKLFVFSNGLLRENNKKVEREYKEDKETKEIKLNNIKYLKDKKTNVQTIISEVDLNDVKKDVKVSSYLMDMTEAYISKENIYLLDSNSYDHDEPTVKDILGFKGIFGLNDKIDTYDYQSKTNIYKFNINKNGIKYQTSGSVEGTIVNQYSVDEKDNNLRISLHKNSGSNVTVLDKNLRIIGQTENVAEGERMYATRFIGDKAYLVTYKNTDPLFVIDLKNPKNPKVLGELKIPGYSTYLHPYDENHLIGIGMETEEVVNRDSQGSVISSWTRTVGMKMSLFDISDVNEPKQVDSTVIGDSRTVSAILTNPKALLFSKDKNLLAIPVNNYDKDFSSRTSSSTNIETDDYVEEMKDYIAEGYLVYNVDLNGFKLKGSITHKTGEKENYYYSRSELLRGVYIDDDLYTVSESAIKVNDLKDLKEISSIKVRKEKGDI